MKIYSIYKTLINPRMKNSFGIAKTRLAYIQNSHSIIQWVFLRASGALKAVFSISSVYFTA